MKKVLLVGLLASLAYENCDAMNSATPTQEPLQCDRATVNAEIIDRTRCPVDPKFKDWIAFLCGVEVHPFPGPFSSLAAFRAASDAALENNHDYVQLVFPNHKPGVCNKDYYLDTSGSVEYGQPLYEVLYERLMDEHSTIGSFIRSNAKQNVLRMLHFWGFSASVDNADKLIISQQNTTVIKKKLTGGNHNQLRMTRVLHFLRILGMHDYATAIKAQLATINPGTYEKYWKNA